MRVLAALLGKSQRSPFPTSLQNQRVQHKQRKALRTNTSNPTARSAWREWIPVGCILTGFGGLGVELCPR